MESWAWGAAGAAALVERGRRGHVVCPGHEATPVAGVREGLLRLPLLLAALGAADLLGAESAQRGLGRASLENAHTFYPYEIRIMSESAGATLSATSGRGLLPLCGGVGPPGAGVFSSPQLQICGLSSAAVEGLGAALRSISGVAEAVPKPLTRGESPLQPPRSATKSTRRSTHAVSSLFGGRPSSTAT